MLDLLREMLLIFPFDENEFDVVFLVTVLGDVSDKVFRCYLQSLKTLWSIIHHGAPGDPDLHL